MRLITALLPLASCITLDITDADSIKSAAAIAAQGMISFYNGDQPGGIPGLLPPPYYWWEAGAMWGGLVDYWYYTGDDTYLNMTTEALLFQVGPNNDYMPPNQTTTEGNDDQAFWAIAVMGATERNFPNPPEGQPQWLALAQAVFNEMALRWDNTTCNGGLRWQIFPFNNGYNYKNTISNGCLFHLAARLARYTGNETYADWAESAWEWSIGVGYGDPSNNWAFYDGADLTTNCTNINHIQWSYNAASYLIGAAYMYNFTNGDPTWANRTQSVLDGMSVFFAQPSNILYEAACEPSGQCNVDQQSFKAYACRFMSYAAQVAPFINDQVKDHIQTSAPGAASACTGATNGTMCGLSWLTSTYDGYLGVGEQMAAMECFQNLLVWVNTVSPPVTANTGGSSTGDAGAGSSGTQNPIQPATGPTTSGDKVGAGFLTVFVFALISGFCYWLIV